MMSPLLCGLFFVSQSHVQSPETFGVGSERLSCCVNRIFSLFYYWQILRGLLVIGLPAGLVEVFSPQRGVCVCIFVGLHKSHGDACVLK